MAKISKLKNVLSGFLIFLLVLFGLGVIYIKTNTQSAAEFTDNTLRPLLGTNTVIFMEKIFFNLSDKVQQLTQNNNPTAPQITDDDSDNPSSNSNLSLTPIPSITSFKTLSHEGFWKPFKLNSFPDKSVMASTFVRPDPLRSYAIVTLVQMDMKALKLGLVAGTKEPGGWQSRTWYSSFRHPEQQLSNRRLWRWFQYRDGQYGMIVGDKTYLPLQSDLGTLIGYQNGDLKIIDYGVIKP